MIKFETALLAGNYILKREDITFKQLTYMISNSSYNEKDFLVEDGYDSKGYDKAEDIDLDDIFILNVEASFMFSGYRFNLSISPEIDLIEVYTKAPYKVLEALVADLNSKEVPNVE